IEETPANPVFLSLSKVQAYSIRSRLLKNTLDMLFRPGRNFADVLVESINFRWIPAWLKEHAY
ncbi:unnamed protein product, partial [marine sediment metagenome]